MFASFARAAAMVLDRELRGLVLWSLGLAAVLFVVLLAGAEYGLTRLPALGWPWINWLLEGLAPVALAVTAFALGAPVAAALGTALLGRIAAKVDARFYPGQARQAGNRARSLGESLRLVALAVLVNLALLPLDVGVPFLAEAATVLIDGWLLGTALFDIAALRHLPPQKAQALRRANGWKVYGAGLAIAVLTAIPGADLIAPFFGAALMANLSRRLAQGSP